jgi:hypothetical protein
MPEVEYTTQVTIKQIIIVVKLDGANNPFVFLSLMLQIQYR